MWLDADMVDWFKAPGPGYQSRMNAVLRADLAARVRDITRSSALGGTGLFDERYPAQLVTSHQGGVTSRQRGWALIMFDAFLGQSWRRGAAAGSSQAARLMVPPNPRTGALSLGGSAA